MTLKPWRDVVRPHKDVHEGRYKNAEFAADLAQVAAGKADREYQDPVEFYNRTFLTTGMARLLTTALQRLAGQGGEPIVQLKTAFGGGKTHTMLALYHLFSGANAKDLRDVGPVLDSVGITDLPKANIAVLVGTALDANVAALHPKLQGKKVNTLWGHMAASLGGEDGYAMVAEADKNGIAPGADTLVELFDKFGPCVVLIDELVAYARNLHGVKGRLTGGSFDSVLTFVQNVTEAAKRSENSLIVASIPESMIEIGGEAGQATLEALEHTYGRLKATWSPVQTEEGFEIVRRRLFTAVEDEKTRDAACKAFHDMYRKGDEFPAEVKEKEYLERLRHCYPIHPEVFDRLYQDWASLERFQRTRGVLRLMAAVIHQLWTTNDKSLLIMPGNMPLHDSGVRNEFCEYIGDQWQSVIETDIDGKRSNAEWIDGYWDRIGRYTAARKVARTIFLGSAPSVKEQKLRGVERVRVFLGVMGPDEQIGSYADALHRLQDRCLYLYPGQDRFWFDTRPSLRKTVEDRASQWDQHDVEADIIRRLEAVRGRGEFAGRHVCPANNGEVPDDDEVRLVILRPGTLAGGGSRDALDVAKRILEKRGNSPRIYQNMLVFLAPDKQGMENCQKEVRRRIAWQSVLDDKKQLGLDAGQQEQAERERDRAEETIGLRLREAYCWLLVPEKTSGTGEVEWETKRLTSSEGTLYERASKKLVADEQLIVSWSPALLKMELDRWKLWGGGDHVSTKKVWEYLATYLYLPRLRDRSVLQDTISAGLQSEDFFGYAAAYDGGYRGLTIGKAAAMHIDDQSLLVKAEVALKSVAAKEAPLSDSATSQEAGTRPLEASGSEAARGVIAEPGSLARRFWSTVNLDPEDAGLKVSQILESIVEPMLRENGSKVKLVLEVEAENDRGFSEKVRFDVRENCSTLKIKGRFEEG
jgi:predicted AAA+ superfamily ATPase